MLSNIKIMNKKLFLFSLQLTICLSVFAQYGGYGETHVPWKYTNIHNMVGDSFYLCPMYDGYLQDLLKKSYIHNEKGKFVKASRFVDHTALQGDFLCSRVVTIKGDQYAEFISHNIEIYLPIDRIGQMLKFIYSYTFWDDTLAACNKKYGAVKTSGSFYRNHIGNPWDKNVSDRVDIVFEDYQYEGNYDLGPKVIIRIGKDRTKELEYSDFCELLKSGILVTKETLEIERIEKERFAKKLESYDSIQDHKVHLFTSSNLVPVFGYSLAGVSMYDIINSDILERMTKSEIMAGSQVTAAEHDSIPVFLFRQFQENTFYFAFYQGKVIAIDGVFDNECSATKSYPELGDFEMYPYVGERNYFERRQFKNKEIRTRLAFHYDSTRVEKQREEQHRLRELYVLDSIRMQRHYDSIKKANYKLEKSLNEKYPFGIAYISNFRQNSVRGIEPCIVWQCINEDIKIKYIRFTIKAYNKVGDLIDLEYSHSKGTYKFAVGQCCSYSEVGECTYFDDWAEKVELSQCSVQTYDGVWHNVGIGSKPKELYETYYLSTDCEPCFPGGQEALTRYLEDNLKYPQKAREDYISGMVFVSFTVEISGHISDIKTLNDIGGNCGAEAIRVIQNMPEWIPGRARGTLVRKDVTIPISFNL